MRSIVLSFLGRGGLNPGPTKFYLSSVSLSTNSSALYISLNLNINARRRIKLKEEIQDSFSLRFELLNSHFHLPIQALETSYNFLCF